MRRPANRLLINAARRSPDSTPSVRRRRLRRSLASRTRPMSTISRQSSTHRQRAARRSSRFAWLRANPVPVAPITLVHADFRNGNMVVDDNGLAAVLDGTCPGRRPDARPCVDVSSHLALRQRRQPVGGFDPSLHFAPGKSRRAVAGARRYPLVVGGDVPGGRSASLVRLPHSPAASPMRSCSQRAADGCQSSSTTCFA